LGPALSLRCDEWELKNQITTGEGTVTQVLKVDEKNRLLYFLAAGREKGRDPYFSHFYRTGFDGKNLSLLTPEDANHEISLSPAGSFFFDSYSKPDVPPAGVLRSSDGKLIAALEKADISKLLATGWKPPQPITVKARDGATDLYGLMFKPTNLDEKKNIRSSITSIPARRRQRRQSLVLSGAWRCAGTRRTRLHRGGDRWHGKPDALEKIPRFLLCQHG